MKISVLGLGYVGLPLTLAFARNHSEVVGYDIDDIRVRELLAGNDPQGEMGQQELAETRATFSSDVNSMRDSDIFVVAVPTPITEDNRPDLRALLSASVTVGDLLQPGGTVVYESTVFPGAVEDYCGPQIEKTSGLMRSQFQLGYSPERISPGKGGRRLEEIVKVVAGQDHDTLMNLATLYESIIPAGVFRAASIKVAEAAKVIENTQRDLNIALMNELSFIFDRLDIPTRDVLEAANSKWNFMDFTPGLVGGHCISVDPYYLAYRAEETGYSPEVILSGRRVNSRVPKFIATKTMKMLISSGRELAKSSVAVLGITFKEDVADTRNSRVPAIVSELNDFGVSVVVHDPRASREQVSADYGIDLVEMAEIRDVDALILAVPHSSYIDLAAKQLPACLNENGIIIDVKSVLSRECIPPGVRYWSM
jgi:UDP-N-acetyl-D-galactosamine dehydrogenase